VIDQFCAALAVAVGVAATRRAATRKSATLNGIHCGFN
jgi:hypothetical protein